MTSLFGIRHLGCAAVRYAILSLSLFMGGLTACAGTSKPAPQPNSAQPPKRAPRRIGIAGKPGKRELEAAIKAAKAGNLDLAIQKSNEAIEKNPKSEHAYLLLGSACAMKEDSACERAAYKRGIEALPQSAPLKKELGLWYLQRDEVQSAISMYEAAMKLSGGKDPEYMADLAYAYVFAGKLDDAEQLATQALKIDGACFTCAMSLGQAKLSKRDFPGAVNAYSQAAKIDKTSGDAKHGLAKGHFLAGDFDEAAQLYEGLLRASPEDHRLRVQTSQVLMAQKNYAAAAKHLQTVAEANPGQKALLKLLLEAQTKAKDKKGAKATKKKLRSLGSK